MKAISANNIGKVYRLGVVNNQTIKEDFNRFWRKLSGKENQLNFESHFYDDVANGDFMWALKDINFEINKGDVVGVIGKNGAGKSTLLKILSRITTPTVGNIKTKGRISSLLEVGTGFHPELTGRQNIYLNGSILGMSKKEITRKFDEIVEFSGIEKYLDTPVKRYSSGMYVRLAFAVAANLEPDILIIDEVLAVGDAEFQRKAIGKMREVNSMDGRTVLFVSHNTDAIASMTSRCLYLDKGLLIADGPTGEVLMKYMKNLPVKQGVYTFEPSEERPVYTRAEVITSYTKGVHKQGDDLIVELEIYMPEVMDGMAVSFQIFNENGVSCLFNYVFDVDRPLLRKQGINKLKCIMPKCKLYQGTYYLRLHLANSRSRAKYDEINHVCQFEITMMQKPIEWGWQSNVCVYMEDVVWEEEK